MKTAQINNKKNLVITILVAFVLFLSFKTGALAQTAVNPFIPTKTKTSIDKTDPTRTIAQDKIALTAIPPRLGDDGSLTVAPGEKIQVQVRVRNISDRTVSVVTSAQDFILDTDGATPVPIDNASSNRWSLASWLTITPSEHKIAPKSTVGINVLIEVPEDALPGGHYAMIVHEPGEKQVNKEFLIGEGSGSAVSQKVGTLLYVVVKGDINEEAYIRDFNFPSFTEYGPVPFSYTIENNSDVHIVPKASLEIYNLFNQKLETIVIEPKNIFPLSSREFNGQWDRVWGWGPYKAKLTMSYSSAGSVVVAYSNFWLLPLKLILASLTMLLILGFVAFSIKKHLDHRRQEAEAKIKELESKIEAMQLQDNQEKTK